MDEAPHTQSEPTRRPGRRRRRVLVWGPAGLIVLVLVLLALPFVLVHFADFRQMLLDRSLSGVFAPGVSCQVGEVARLDPGGFDLRDVRFHNAEEGRTGQWMRIGRLRASWNPFDLIGRRVVVYDFEVETVEVETSALPTRLFRASSSPTPRTSFLSRPRLDLPPLSCDVLSVTGVEVRRSGERWLEAGLRLEDLDHEDDAVSLRLAEGRVRVPSDSLELSLARGALRGTLIEDLRVDSLEVRATGLDASLVARLLAAPAGSTGVTLDGRLELASLRPTDVPPLRRLTLPWNPRDEVSGELAFTADLQADREPRSDLVLGLRGRLWDTPLDTLQILAEATPELAELLDFHGRFGAVVLEGEGRWQPRLRSAQGEVRFREVDLGGRPIARFVDGLPGSRLAGSVAGHADSIGRGLRVRADVRLDQGTILDRPLAGFRAQVELDPEEVRLDTLYTNASGRPTLMARGVLDRVGERLQVTGRFDRFPMESWIEPWIREGLGGAVSGPFQVSGPLRALEVAGDLGVRNGRVVEVFVDTLSAGAVRGTLTPLRIHTQVRAWGGDFYEIGADSVRGHAVIGDTIRADMTAFRDTTRIAVRGRVTPMSHGAVFIDTLRVEPGSAPMVALAHPTVLHFSPTRVWIDSLCVRSSAGEAWGTGWILPRPGGEKDEPFEFQVYGWDVDLGDVADYFGLPADSLNGMADVEFTGQGTPLSPGYAFTVEAHTAEVYGWLWERAYLRGRAGAIGDPSDQVAALDLQVLQAPRPVSLLATPSPRSTGVVHLDSLHAVAHGYVGRLPIFGPERYGPEPPGSPLEIEARDLQVASPRSWADWVGLLENDSLFFSLNEAELSGLVRVDDVPAAPILSPILVPRAHQGTQTTFAEPLDPMLAVIRVERAIPEGQEAAWRPPGLGGRVSLSAEVGGTGRHPSVRLRGLGEDIQVYQAFADSVLFQATYLDSLLYIPELSWRTGGRGVRVSGRVPLALSADPGKARLLERPLWLEAEVPSVDLSLASLATTLIEDPSGDLSGRVRLKGVPPHVYIEGRLGVENGAFRIPTREERVSAVRADLRLDSLGVHIVTARGKWNDSGDVEVSGRYRNETDFSLEGRATNALIFESGNYRFLADGTFEASPVVWADSLRPQLRGDVLVHEGTITMDLARPGRERVLVTPWLIDLHVSAPSNVRVVQPVSDVELAGGRLEVRYEMPFWNLSGEFDVRRGSYRVFNTRFEIVEGTVEFLDTGTGPFPLFDVIARTEVVDPETGETIEVRIEVNGSPLPGEQLDIVMTSPDRPGYNSADLTRLLSLGQLTSGELATGSSTDPARGFLTGEVLNRLEREMLGDLGILNRVDVGGGSTAEDPFTVSVRAIAQPGWSVRYSTELASNPGQEVSLNYRLSTLFFLDAAVDRRPTDLGVTTETYTLDFKFRWEY